MLYKVLFFFLLPFMAAAQTFTAKVVGVKDGDSIEVLDSLNQTHKIRLAHIDCPEPKQAFSKVATQLTSDFCFQKTVLLRQTDVDRYKRLVCVVEIEGRILNLELVQAGLAWHYKKYSSAQEYAAAETSARTVKTGLWMDPYATAPWDFRKNRH